MRQITHKTLLPQPEQSGGRHPGILYQLSPQELKKRAVEAGEGILSGSSALAVSTGEFTGRSPEDRYIVRDRITDTRVSWNDVNIPFGQNMFDRLYTKVVNYLASRHIFVRDSRLCADTDYALTVRSFTEYAFQDLFISNMFINPDALPCPQPEWTILAAPGFRADPQTDGTRQHNFSIINFSRRTVLIGGTAYTGEIKKAMFSVLNFLLPYKGVLPMHCAANRGANGDTAVFFGLSGTGKTTLSADPERDLIGDDEHGWSGRSIFNFEGGCYAKAAGLTPANEPQICRAIRGSALLENVGFFKGTDIPDFSDIQRTENTRVSYPLTHISNAVIPSVGAVPKNVFFLTADAFGVLPPISRLTRGQAMYHFISGYTAKVAGTEYGINEPQATFSACFAKAFLPLHATRYAALLGRKLENHAVNVWLVNTGWTGGAYGAGKRISLSCTRSLIRAALSGSLDHARYYSDPVFGLAIPEEVSGVPATLLNPAEAWPDKSAYLDQAARLAGLFNQNFRQFAGFADEEILASAPKLPDRSRMVS
jgi:phosphoenolpyruvate carboxykinase (ATP)